MFSKSFNWYDITYLLTSICFHTGWVGSIHQKLDKKLKMDSLWYLKLKYSEYMTSVKFPGSLSSPIRVLEAQTVKMRSQHKTLCKNKCIFETVAGPWSRSFQISIWTEQFFCHLVHYCLIIRRCGNAFLDFCKVLFS